MGCRGEVTPISFLYASAEKDSRLACCAAQPNLPTAVLPGASTDRYFADDTLNSSIASLRLIPRDASQDIISNTLHEPGSE